MTGFTAHRITVQRHTANERSQSFDGHLVADFNDAIIVNNMGTSTGMIFFKESMGG